MDGITSAEPCWYELCAVLYHAYTCCRSCVRAGHEGMFSHQHRQCHQSWNRHKTLIPRYLWSVAHGSISSVKSEQDNSVSSLWVSSSFTWRCLANSFGTKVGEQSSSRMLCLEVLQFYTSATLNRGPKWDKLPHLQLLQLLSKPWAVSLAVCGLGCCLLPHAINPCGCCLTCDAV